MKSIKSFMRCLVTALASAQLFHDARHEAYLLADAVVDAGELLRGKLTL